MNAAASGVFGRAVFDNVTGVGLAVPETAIRFDADGASVMTVGPDNRVKQAIVQTGQRGGGWVQIVKGPPAGTRIVQNAAAFLLDNDLVRPIEGGAATAAAASASAAPAKGGGK